METIKTRLLMFCAFVALFTQSASASTLTCNLYTHTPYSGTVTQDTYSWTQTVVFHANAIPGQYYYSNGAGSYEGVIKTAPTGTAQTVGIRGVAAGTVAPYTAVSGPQWMSGMSWAATSAVYQVGGVNTTVTFSAVGQDHIERNDIGQGPSPTALTPGVARVGSLVYTIGAPPPVPPRSVTFDISFTNFSPTEKALKLLIDGVETESVDVPAAYSQTSGEFVHALFGPHELSGGGFGWSVTFGGDVLGTGAVGPLDEIPNDTIYVWGGYTSGYDPTPDAENDAPDTAPGPETAPENVPSPGGGTRPPSVTNTGGTPGPPGSPGGGGTSGGGGNGGDVNVMNTNDFYAPFKKALDDFGSEGELGNIDVNTRMETVEGVEAIIPEDPTETGEIDDVSTLVTDIIDKMTESIAAFKAKLPAAFNLPHTFGSWTAISGTLPLVPPRPFSFSLIPISEYIDIMRRFELLVMTITFWFLTAKAIRGAFAGS